MKTKTIWKEKMLLTGEVGNSAAIGNATSDPSFQVAMDAKPPIGTGASFTPKELVILGLSGCTGMDVVALMRKHKQTMESFEISAEVTPTQGPPPTVFEKIELSFVMTGIIDERILIESVNLSQNKYCGVSAMLAKACPIFYKISLNGKVIHQGQAHW